MPAKHLEANVRHLSDAAVIELRGQIDGFAQEALNAAYTEAEAGEPEVVLINFEGVDYINSTGIALIVGLLARAAKRRLLACNLIDRYVEIFNITLYTMAAPGRWLRGLTRRWRP